MRPTTAADAEKILRFLWDYFKENQEIMPMDIEFDLDECWQFIKRALDNERSIGFISDDGVFLGEVAQPWFAKTSIARGHVWYVRPAARGSFQGCALMDAFEKEAQERGAKYSQLALDNAAHLEMIAPLMEKFGYADYSKIFLKNFERDNVRKRRISANRPTL